MIINLLVKDPAAADVRCEQVRTLIGLEPKSVMNTNLA